jgi:hypothetical protein
MVKATQHGHKLKGLRPGTQAELQQTAKSMKPSDVEDFTRTAKDRKPAWGGRKPTGRYRKRIKAQEVEEGDFRL